MVVAFVVAGMIHQPAPVPGTGYFGFYLDLNGSTIALTGVPMLLVFLAWLVYQTTMEWAVGASVGKFVTGVRVATQERSTMSLGGSSIRNVLRIIDSLPFYYLLGFILVKASETRLGDKAAKTDVYRRGAVPAPRNVGGLVGGLVLSAVLVAAVPLFYTQPAGGPSSSDGHYSANGISFDHPASWQPMDASEGEGSVGDPFFADRLGTEDGGVTVSGYHLAAVVTDDNAEQTREEIQGLADGMSVGVGGELTEPLSLIHVAGKPTWTFGTLVDGWMLRQYLILDGDTEYAVACEWPEGTSEVEAACADLVASIRLGSSTT
jgi:uncharacterized RDD family membrane protein YckC